MSTPYSIEVVNLAKQYEIGRLVESQRLKDAAGQMARQATRSLGRVLRGKSPVESRPRETFWALRDVSVNVAHGEVLGVIGRNGAGKSTFLKILTRITSPTEGYARIRGRVGALLEVGTGFHHELTGRENIFMSGALLGMPRAEIMHKFDEIVSFSGVERFIDTPVKRYSSGMYLRLAFAVSAHLEPDVLLVDEVLAVGDAEFQQRSLGKMEGVAEQGRTVLFVSHNMDAVRHLCHKALWLDDGQPRLYGDVNDVVDAYLQTVVNDAAHNSPFPIVDEKTGLGLERCDVELTPNDAGQGLDLNLKVTVSARQKWPRVGLGLGLFTPRGVKLLSWGAHVSGNAFDLQQGHNHFRLRCPRIDQYLSRGEYIISLWLELPGLERIVEVAQAGIITLPGVDLFGTGKVAEQHRHGPLLLPFQAVQQHDA